MRFPIVAGKTSFDYPLVINRLAVPPYPAHGPSWRPEIPAYTLGQLPRLSAFGYVHARHRL